MKLYTVYWKCPVTFLTGVAGGKDLSKYSGETYGPKETRFWKTQGNQILYFRSVAVPNIGSHISQRLGNRFHFIPISRIRIITFQISRSLIPGKKNLKINRQRWQEAFLKSCNNINSLSRNWLTYKKGPK